MKVLVVGGGIAGLSFAIAAERDGAEVDLVEHAAVWTSAGAAITLRPLAVKALTRLGLLDEVVRVGRVVERQCALSMAGDTIRARVLADEEDTPTVVIHRRQLQQVLSDQLKTTNPLMGVRPNRISSHQTRVEVALSNGDERDYDVVVGADGIHSWLRTQLFPEAVVRPVGQQYWRFCVEGEVTPDWCVVAEQGRFVALLPLPGLTYCAAQVAGSALLDERTEPRAALYELFGKYPFPVSGVLARVTDSTEIHFGGVSEVLLERWSSGPVALIGDAAHALSPILTLGGGLAIEDAVVLAEELHRGETPTDALAAFTTRRRPRVELVRELANAQAASYAGVADLDEADYQDGLARLRHDP
jgi:2-polyprenyl-6-methoxyphenol hydroxylase-like FAD-dependent oxidoreductase